MISAEDRALAKEIVDAIKADGGYTPDGPLTITADLYYAMMYEMNTRLRMETEQAIRDIGTPPIVLAAHLLREQGII